MVHSAFNTVSIIDKFPHKIEAIESWGGKLLVGTEGVLFIYEVKETNDGRAPFSVALIDAQKSFAKKPIVQLTVVEKYNILISLSDGFISIHDLPSFNLRCVLGKSRGCHLYALDKSKNPLTLCVAIKRKLLIFTWDGTEFEESKELAIPDIARTLVWCGDSICIGFRREYNLINVQTGAMTELFPTGKSGTPIATLLPNEQILLGRDNISIFIGFDSKPTRKYGLSWSETPTVLGYSFPYVIAVLSKFVEVRIISGSSTLVQTLPLKAPRLLSIKDGEIYIAAQNSVWRVVPVPILQQVEELVKDREYEEALTLCENIPDSDNSKSAKVKSIKILYSYHLFSQGQYDRSMDYFMELECDPLQVIGLYPNLLPLDLRAQYSYPIEIPALVSPGLERALQALNNYLVQIRSTIPATSTQESTMEDDYASVKDMLVIIDTSLLKSYIKTNDTLLFGLLKRPNKCHVKECEKVLLNHKKFSELVLLYKGKNLHRNALELLSRLGQGTKGGTMYGVTDSINYLKELGKEHLGLIMEFSRWLLQSTPEAALAIFTEPRPDESALPTGETLTHIKSLAPTLVVPFLEHIIQKRKETAAEFHNDLIFNYLDTILTLKRHAVFQKSSSNVPTVAGSEPGSLGFTRKKLIQFLEESQYYNPEKMLSRFPFDDLYEERAILLSRIGQHDKALEIYAHKLKDPTMAENYCARHYTVEKEESRDVYLSLLRVYLKPPEPQSLPDMEDPALQLLNKYYQQIDIPKALELLPPDIAIGKLLNVFQSVLRDNSKTRRNNQVIKNLLKSENLQVREQLIRTRSRVIKIGEDRMCPVCSKRIGYSAFACYPNGVVVHYHCRDKVSQELVK